MKMGAPTGCAEMPMVEAFSQNRSTALPPAKALTRLKSGTENMANALEARIDFAASFSMA
ncbi:MAG TPA: hypothetical protein VKG92_01390 [Flavobacteriales bacterium]|nr:hypothetical protein [Flavobacteriales bacterium]